MPDTVERVVDEAVIAEAGRRLAKAAGDSARVIVVSSRYADEWRDVRGGLVHAALGEGRVLAG